MNKFDIKIDTSKNLLAFSAGIDSTALFFILLESDIPFDIAIVDYNQRVQSKDEVIYATQLAHKYNKKCYISEYKNSYNFNEKDARDFRHTFFQEIIKNDGYQSLITAHQLNDKLEWFLMQLTKGAGITELMGMQTQTQNDEYLLLKPLLNYTKEQLKEYLEENNIKYFIDSSNYDEKFTRNYFRHKFSDKLINKYSDGICKSFQYLEEDNKSLLGEVKITKIRKLHIYENFNNVNSAIRFIDKDLKNRGIIISSETRKEIISKKEVVISHKIAISISENKIYIAPSLNLSMDKKFKEKCRLEKIPKNIRAYIFGLYQEELFIF